MLMFAEDLLDTQRPWRKGVTFDAATMLAQEEQLYRENKSFSIQDQTKEGT